MPNIREYSSPIEKLTPDEKGYQAWEMAGRRIGPLYSQMGSEVKEGGRIEAANIGLAGKGQEALLKQAEQLNMDALDYLGVLKEQRAANARNPSSGVSGGGGGGSRRQQPPPQRHTPSDQYAEAASSLATAANKVTGNPGGKAVEVGNQDYANRTDAEAYNQQNPGGISDRPTAAQMNTWVRQGDNAYASRPQPVETNSQSWLSSAYDTVASAASAAYNYVTGDNGSQSQTPIITPDTSAPDYGF